MPAYSLHFHTPRFMENTWNSEYPPNLASSSWTTRPSDARHAGRDSGRRGHEVATAANGEAALAELEREPIDLMLLDLRMDGLDGLQVIEAASKVSRRIPSS